MSASVNRLVLGCRIGLVEVRARHICVGAHGTNAVTTLHAAFPFNGDDFALFPQRVPGAMFVHGVAYTSHTRH